MRVHIDLDRLFSDSIITYQLFRHPGEDIWGEGPPSYHSKKGGVNHRGEDSVTHPQVRLLSKQLSHSVDTHRKHYEQLDTVAGAAQAHRIVQGLASAKPKQQRKQYSNTETVSITAHFSKAIAMQKSIFLAQAREFLDKNKAVRRTPKQVQDKVASITASLGLYN